MIFNLLLVCTVASAEATPIRIAIGSCAHQDSVQRVWDGVLAWQPDLFVHLGDAIYADTRDSTKMRTDYEKAWANTRFGRVRDKVALFSTWDDHDFGENDAGSSYPMRRVAERLFFEFWTDQGDPGRLDRPGVYGSRLIERAGNSVRIILLDTRFFRSDWTPDTSGKRRYRVDYDGSKTILGADQWRWLEEELRMPADLRVIASSIQVVNDEHGWESWGNFPSERKKLLDLISATGAQGVIVVSGDRHFTELSRQIRTNGYPIYDFTASGLTEVAHKGHLAMNSKRVGDAVTGQNFGGLAVNFAAGTVRFLGFNEAGIVVFDYKIRMSELGVETQ